MKLFARLAQRFRAIKRAVLTPANVLGSEWESEWESDIPSGVTITGRTAIQISAVHACVRVLAESVASLPLKMYRRRASGARELETEHPAARLLHDAPNPLMTSFVFREALQASLCLYGNGYARIERSANGTAAALWPLDASRCAPISWTPQELTYRLTDWNGKQENLPGRDVLHVPGLSLNGFEGFSPIAEARRSLGLSKAAEEFGSRFFGAGARPSGVLQTDQKLNEESYKRAKEQWAQHEGVGRSFRTALLEQGLKWSPLSIPPEDAQFLETRKFQVSEIARIFRVPLHMIGDLERATFSNIEHQSIEFVVHTLRPWLVRWEQELSRKVLNRGDQELYYFEFAVDGLLRGDVKSRFDAYAVGRQWGWLSANDIREMENLNSIPGGDVYLTPANMLPARSVLPAQPTKALRPAV